MKKVNMHLFKLLTVTLIAVVLLISGNQASAQKANPAEYFKIEDYYKIKWGYTDEFIALWKKNHYPLLKKRQEKEDVNSI